MEIPSVITCLLFDVELLRFTGQIDRTPLVLSVQIEISLLWENYDVVKTFLGVDE